MKQDIRILMFRALRGEYVPDLPPAMIVNLARLRERFLAELPALAVEAAGAADFERRWVETVNRIVDDAEASLRIALNPEAGHAQSQ